MAAAGSDEAIEYVVTKAAGEASRLIALQDEKGNTPLHLCSHSPMSLFQLASACPEACLQPNKEGLTPADLAQRHISGEPLNALLLACSSSSSPESLNAIRILTLRGAVPDTWAPNGQSSLMLAAANDNAKGLRLLLQAGASLEMQDSMGRTALMWAAGCGTTTALKELLDSGASVAHRDRRGRTVTEYAAEFPVAAAILESKVKELENKANAAQEALLAELCAEEEKQAATKASKKAKKKAAKEKRRSSIAAVPCVVQESQQSLESEVEEIHPKHDGNDDNEQPKKTTVDSQILEEGLEDKHPEEILKQILDTEKSSPEWITVKKVSGKKGPSLDTHQGPPIKATHQRSPSGVSIASLSSSVTSHDTDARDSHSVNSVNSVNSERSVLRRAPLVANKVANQRQGKVSGPGKSSFSQKQETKEIFETCPAKEDDIADGSFIISSPRKATWANITANVMTGSEHDACELHQTMSTGKCSLSSPQHQDVQQTAMEYLHLDDKADDKPAEAPLPASGTTLSLFGRGTGVQVRVQESFLAQNSNSQNLPFVSSVFGSSNHAPTHINGSGHENEQLLAEIVKLQAEVRRLQLQRISEENAHQQELAAVMQDAALHEASAVASAIQETEMNCIVKFASLLQNQLAASVQMNDSLRGSQGVIHSFKQHQQQQHENMFDISYSTAPAPEKGGGLSPPLSSPFSFEVGEGLRGEYLDNHSAFVVPASEPEVLLGTRFDRL